MKPKDFIASHINKHRLASAMNKTKWRELAAVMTSNPDFNPLVRVRHLLDETQVTGFAHLDWELIKLGETNWIEWIEIDPIRRDYVGRLVNEKEVNFTEWVRAALLSKTIPSEEIDGIFRVRGYIRPNA
ncbi:MAG TPA: DUF6678 family protein [Hymenobacter sp.]|jgi:hypothetical protein